METLRQYRENLQKIYGKNDYWMVPIFRSLFSQPVFADDGETRKSYGDS